MVVGLGNPGPEFAGTRHNVGADAVAALAHRHGVTLRAEKGTRSLVGVADLDGDRVVLAVPTTYMNESGLAVRPLVERFALADPEHLVVVHDELDLPPGRLQVKVGGGLAGHNGLRSIRDHLHSTEFARVRIGIGKPPDPRRGADHVLRRPGRSERDLLATMVALAADAAETLVTRGPEAAMRQVNGEAPGGGPAPR